MAGLALPLLALRTAFFPAALGVSAGRDGLAINPQQAASDCSSVCDSAVPGSANAAENSRTEAISNGFFIPISHEPIGIFEERLDAESLRGWY